jgi:Flp pilus assembly protein CpaB
MRFRIRHLLILIGLAAVIALAIRSHRDQVAKRSRAALIPRGMRAFTILVPNPNLATGGAGSMLPGHKVDVLLAVSGGDLNDISGTTTRLQNVEILAVDQKIGAPAENKPNAQEMRMVTLMVTPYQAKLLDQAQNKGLVHLAPTKVQPPGNAE